jgi:voltage-gated potassium channel
MRKKIFQIIEAADENDRLSKIYDTWMMIIIVLSLMPLTLKYESPMILKLELMTTVIFVIDYILRLMTADYKLKKGTRSFFLYPFTPMAIVDLVSILPTITALNHVFRMLKILRLLRMFRAFRIFKAFRYSKSITIIVNVFRKQKEALMVVGGLAVGYVIVSALIVFSVEPETFPTFFDALYWATVSLTTVGYGDIYAVSTAGKIVTMISTFFGIAIVALPAGIVTAGYMDELNKKTDDIS